MKRAIIGVVIVMLIGLVLGSIGCAQQTEDYDRESPAPLGDWNGTWVNVGTMLDHPAMDAVYEAMTDAANAAAWGGNTFAVDDAKSFLYAMHETNFANLGIARNTITYYNFDGTVRCECEYESAGIETVAFGEGEFDWYRFELTWGAAACSEYKYLILTETHSDAEGGMVHFHMRYGDTGFDDLINNPAYAMWYHTFGAEGTTVEEVVEGYAEGAVMMGAMMLAYSAKEELPASEIHEAIEEIDEHAHELMEATMAVHDNTEKIADDESLKEDLRAMAEEIHVASHDLGHIAEHVHEHVEELEAAASKADYKEALGEIVEHLEEYYAILEAKHDLVHKLLFKTPESHAEYADAVHDTVHEADGIVEDLTEQAQELAEIVGVTIPKSAIKPVAVPEQFIRMYDEQGKLQNLLAEEVAIEAHGHLCVCGTTAFRVTQVAIARLWGQEIPTQGELAVTYQHPSKGHKEVFEYLLGPDNVTYVKTGDPKHLTLADNFVYTFVRQDSGAAVEMQMKEGVIPADFFDLMYEVKGFLKGWHQEKPAEAKKAAFKQRFDQAVNNILSLEASEVFEVGEEVTEIPSEYQETIEELAANAKDLKKLIKRMTKPAHAVPGDVGMEIHNQFHPLKLM